MIEAAHLHAGYGAAPTVQPVLSDISFRVPAGNVCAVIGPSGCGKSTLLRILAGLFSDFSGEVMINGTQVDPKRQTIGFIPQEGGLLPWRTVTENIALGRRVKYPDETLDLSAVSTVAENLGLGGLLSRYPGELSGGQRQRVSLARAFFLRPDILLLDEPFSALDAITREEIQTVFLSLWSECTITTVLVTHSMEEALRLGQEILVLSKLPGRVRAVIHNPLFAENDVRQRPEFPALSAQLRDLLRPGEACL